MKKYIILFSLVLTTILCHSKNRKTENESIVKTSISEDSVFFSYKSICNIKIQFLNQNNAIVNINGKEKKGKISRNKYSKDFFDFKENNTIVATFSFEGSELIIENQKYQFGCEGAKFIILEKVNDDNQVLKEFKEYIKENEFVFDDIISINDKAFCLEQMQCYKTSAYILEQILNKNPDRVVAWLNLADVYWNQNKKTESKKAYNKYVEIMKIQKKDTAKIPKRVFERIK
jgi:tetratricopeptide (TPR) repeat protein